MERLILLCFVLGLSTRKVAEALVPILGEGVSASTVSRVARTLDRAAAAFHGRALKRRYRFLILDGWEGFLSSLYRRGLTGEGLELIITDGGGVGLLAALPLLYPGVTLQRCWVHKTRNVLSYVSASERQARYPRAVNCLLRDEEHPLCFFRVKEPSLWPTLRTTNAIERRFVEVRRRCRPMGVFSDRASMERIMFSVFTHENLSQETGTPFSLTQNS
ncbi:MAG: transposase [Nitrospinota bacterium]